LGNVSRSDNINHTKNKNGVFINLLNLDSNTIDKIEKLLKYYNEIDTRLKGYFPDKIGQTNSNSNITSNKVVQTVAGANSRVGNKTGRRTVKLTPSQVAIAKKLGVPLDEYAKFVKE